MVCWSICPTENCAVVEVVVVEIVVVDEMVVVFTTFPVPTYLFHGLEINGCGIIVFGIGK